MAEHKLALTWSSSRGIFPCCSCGWECDLHELEDEGQHRASARGWWAEEDIASLFELAASRHRRGADE